MFFVKQHTNCRLVYRSILVYQSSGLPVGQSSSLPVQENTKKNINTVCRSKKNKIENARLKQYRVSSEEDKMWDASAGWRIGIASRLP